jgi:hypothetical protein
VLFELFPWLKSELSSAPPSESQLQQEIAQLKYLIVGQGGTPGSKLSGLKPPVTSPILEDVGDQDTIIIRKNTSTDAAMNLVNSMMGLQG